MTNSIRVPIGGRVLVKLIKQQEQSRKSSGGIDLPDTIEQTYDCEGIVLAVSDRPGYELPTWVAERIGERMHAGTVLSLPALVNLIQSLCSNPRESKVAVGDRILFDVSLATFAPDASDGDEFLLDQDNIYAVVTPDSPAVEFTRQAQDSAGFRTRG